MTRTSASSTSERACRWRPWPAPRQAHLHRHFSIQLRRFRSVSLQVDFEASTQTWNKLLGSDAVAKQPLWELRRETDPMIHLERGLFQWLRVDRGQLGSSEMMVVLSIERREILRR